MPTSISSLLQFGKPSSVLIPPELLFQGTTTSLTPQSRNPPLRAKTSLLRCFPSMLNHVLALSDQCSPSSRPRQSPLHHHLPLAAHGLSPHLCGILFYRARHPHLRGHLSRLLFLTSLSIMTLFTRLLPRRREPHLGTPPRLLLRYPHLLHSQRRPTTRPQSQRHFTLCPVLSLTRN